jgi:hypothetical protein
VLRKAFRVREAMANDTNVKPVGYETKFANFIRMCEQATAGDVVVIATPHALGDTYEEIVESLNRLTDADARLTVVPRPQRRME